MFSFLLWIQLAGPHNVFDLRFLRSVPTRIDKQDNAHLKPNHYSFKTIGDSRNKSPKSSSRFQIYKLNSSIHFTKRSLDTVNYPEREKRDGEQKREADMGQ